MSASFSYGRQEKLKSRAALELLFAKGRTLSVFPVKVFYLAKPADQGIVQAGVGVGARYFKKATERNRIKRLLRENYRLHKEALSALAAAKGLEITVFFLYIDKTMPVKDILPQKMPLVIQKLVQQLHEMVTANP